MLIIKPSIKNLGELTVNRALPSLKCKMIGPWVFFDHMGPVNFEIGQNIDVRPHPHINLATVTYLFEGEIFHRDCLGNAQAIYPGDINLMVAGKGITHSERETENTRNSFHKLHGLQLWHALPVEFEEIEPSFHHYESTEIPKINIDTIEITVMIGKAYGKESPVKTFCNTLYIEIKIPKNKEINVPEAEELGVYVIEGEIIFKENQVLAQEMLVLDQSYDTIRAVRDTKLVIIGGENIGPRHIFWNFVSSKKSRIEQAKKDWKNGKFKKIDGDDKEFIPLPDH